MDTPDEEIEWEKEISSLISWKIRYIIFFITIGLAITPPVHFVVSFLAKPFQYKVGILIPDSFFYFTYAVNMAQGNFYSWNGVYPSNGFHPLWAILISPIFGLSANKSSALDFMIIFSFMLFAASLVLILKDQIERHNLIMGIAGSSAFGFWGGVAYFNGLETGLVMFLLILFIRVFGYPNAITQKRKVRFYLCIGTVSSLIVLTRLDYVILIAPVIAWIWITSNLNYPDRPFFDRRYLIISFISMFGPPLLIIGTYMSLNYMTTGMLQPISAATKSTFPNPINPIQSLTVAHEYIIGFGLLGISILATGIWLILSNGSRYRMKSLNPYQIIVLFLVIGSALHFSYHTMFTLPGEVGTWYFIPYSVIAILSIVGASSRVIKRIFNWRMDNKIPFVIFIIIVVFLIAPGLTNFININEKVSEFNSDTDTVSNMVIAGDYAKKNLGPNTSFYEGGNGIFAYLTGFPTYTMNGLSNTPEYISVFRKKQGLQVGSDQWIALHSRYFARNNISYVVDRSIYSSYNKVPECVLQAEYEFIHIRNYSIEKPSSNSILIIIIQDSEEWLSTAKKCGSVVS